MKKVSAARLGGVCRIEVAQRDFQHGAVGKTEMDRGSCWRRL